MVSVMREVYQTAYKWSRCSAIEFSDTTLLLNMILIVSR
jgi:hypothetical protein